ncbi:MAG: hypothetical protein HYT20_02170 [Candidatus Nealsonbacteria bacterium]|nr:hypothetical protein [Candidatus Nealsonbacteria bacterium]
MVSVAIFSFVVTSVSGIFATSIKLQRRSVAYQQLLDQTSYLAEYMSKAVRMAKKDISGACTGAAKLNYSFSGQCLKFLNYKDQCQQFCLDSARMKDQNGDYLTSGDLSILSFSVDLSGQTQDDNIQPKTAISLDVQGKENLRLKIQTAVSQRNLDVRR